MRARPAELRADFRQFYGVGMGELGRSLPVSEAADLAACLPAGSRCATPEGQAWGWDDTRWLLARIEHGLRVLAWHNTEDGRKGRNAPRMLTPGLERVGDEAAGVTSGELDDLLKRRRG